MQRVMRTCHLLSLSRCVSHALPVKKLELPVHFPPVSSESLCYQRFFCVRTVQQRPAEPVVKSPPTETNVRQQRSRHSLSIFLRRVLDTIKLLNVLNQKPWDDEDTPSAVQSCNAKLTVGVVTEVIKICTDLDTALAFFEWWRAIDGNVLDSYVYVALMHRLGKEGRIEELEAVASECECDGLVTVATFTVQISSYKRSGDLDKALHAWRRMEKFGIAPNLLSYTTMIDVLASMKLYDEAGDLFLLFLWERFRPNVRTLTVLIYHLIEAGKLDGAVAIFDDLLKVGVKPNAITFASLMQGYATVGNMDAVVNLVRQFKDVGHRPHPDTFKGFFQYLLGEKRVADAVNVMLELWPGYSTDDCKGLVSYYRGESRRYLSANQDAIVELLSDASDGSDETDDDEREKMSSYPTSLWNFTGFIRCLTPWSPATAAALEHADVKWDGHLVSEIMKRIKRVDVGWKFFIWVEGQQGFVHDRFTYFRMIQLLLTEGNFVIVKQLLVEAQTKKLILSLHMYNKILKFCGMKSQSDVALDVFNLLENSGLRPDQESFHNLIHALHKCGRYWRAATVFAEMQKAGIAPSAAIYSFVVSGFAEVGNMSYAKAYYKRLRASGFEPSDRIYQAFIHGFSKTGKLDKAEQVFKQMKKDGMIPSGQVYDMMAKIFKQAGKTVELGEIQRERASLMPSIMLKKRANFENYVKFYSIFKESFAESDDVQMYATG